MGQIIFGGSFGHVHGRNHRSKDLGNGRGCSYRTRDFEMVKSERCSIRGQGEVTPSEWAGMGVAVVTLISSFYFMVRYMVRSVMSELMPNGGNSLRDQVSRIENRLDNLYALIAGKD